MGLLSEPITMPKLNDTWLRVISAQKSLNYQPLPMCMLWNHIDVLVQIEHPGEQRPQKIIRSQKIHEKLDGKTKVGCWMCGKYFPLHAMRNHVGQHILWDMHGQEDPNIKVQPVSFI